MVPIDGAGDAGDEEAREIQEVLSLECGTPSAMSSRQGSLHDIDRMRKQHDHTPQLWGYLGATILHRYRSHLDRTMREMWSAAAVTRPTVSDDLPGETWSVRIAALQEALARLEELSGRPLTARAALPALLEVEPRLEAATAAADALRFASDVRPWPEIVPPADAAPLLEWLQAFAGRLDGACDEVEVVAQEWERSQAR